MAQVLEMTATTTNKIGVVITTTASREDAVRISKELLADKLIACVQLSKIESFYEWKGQVEEEVEYRLMIKHALKTKKALVEKLLVIHPYETPEIITTEFDSSLGYYKWCEEVCSPALS